MQLVVTEKPSVAQAISHVIGAKERKDGYMEGNGFLVSWCVGHLVELAQPEMYSEAWKKWSYESLPMIPEQWQHEVKKETATQYKILKNLMHDTRVESVVCATDAGREGELIFRLVYEQAGCRKPMKRLWISSMEESAIRDGFENLKPGSDYDSLYQSALCRQQADWLVGLNGTRLFTVLYGGKVLKVGRVQTPTLAMLVDREVKIMNFEKEQYYMAHILMDGIDAMTERIDDKARAESIAAACESQSGVVRSVIKENKSVAPPKLYDLTTLQRDANRIFGFTAKQTLEYTQSLYEKKLVTYPRTDSQYLSDDMEETAKAVIGAVYQAILFEEQTGAEPDIKRVLNSKKVTDHHAVIPTRNLQSADPSGLPVGERMILELVALRLLCAVAEPHTYSETAVTVECAGAEFTTKGKTVKRPGWRALDTAYRAALKNAEPDKETEDKALPDGDRLPELSEGQTLPLSSAAVKEGKTSPPKHFTEDTLLSAMETAGKENMPEDTERKGLGTPATRAGILEKLVSTGFLERKKSKKAVQLMPSKDAVSLITVLPEQLQSPLLTAEWEHRLSEIERGELSPEDFMGGICAMLRELVGTYQVIKGTEYLFTPPHEVVGKCPRCGGDVAELQKGFFCQTESCKFAIWKNNKWWAAKKKQPTKALVTALLKDGRARITGCYSEKTGKTYDATVVLEDDGRYANFKLEFDRQKGGSR